MRPFTRRAFLAGAGSLVAAAATASRTPSLDDAAFTVSASDAAALAALGRTHLRYPGSRFDPSRPPGVDLLPGIDHIVVLMLENHSYDNFFGVLPSSRANGTLDGLPRAASAVTSWNPYGVTSTNPTGSGARQHAFLMPSTCQLPAQPSNTWTASHVAYDGGRMDGFVTTPIGFGSSTEVGPVAMGYWDGDALPFTYSLADAFPVADRWFSSVPGQTDPNRRYLIAATSSGMVSDVALSSTLGVSEIEADALLAVPAGGTIFDLLTLFGISWGDYAASYPTGATAELYPVNDFAVTKSTPFSQFFTDCANGSLPSFSLLDPDYGTQSQENPQDITAGEAVLAKVVEAIGSSPTWTSTMLVVTYDEFGGYYDHVPPPAALAPDPLPPVVQPGEPSYDGFHRYGFRVPAVVVSPYAVPNGVSHTVYDHTSVLAMVERKWNLPAMTFRDANANDLTGFLDMDALASGTPTFPVLPPLAAPGTSNCPADLASLIPPAGSVS